METGFVSLSSFILFQSHPPLLERLAALKGDEKKTD